MAPPKAPKKAKLIEKPIEKPIAKSKKMKKKSYRSFKTYIFRVLKDVAPDFGIARQSMVIVNNFVNDMMETLALEASRLVPQGKKTTLSTGEIQTAVRLLIPGELGKHANIQAVKALQMYHSRSNV